MNILNLFKKTPKEQPPQEAQDTSAAPELEIYSGMRVEVTTFDGRLLFVAPLKSTPGSVAELHQSS